MPAVAPVPFVVPFYVDQTGAPLAGGSIETFAAGTTSPLATYSDPAGDTPNNTTIYLNNAGQPETNGIYLDETLAYKFVWFDANNAQVSERDNITATAGVGLATNNVWTGSNTFTQFLTAAGLVSNGTTTVNGATSGLMITAGVGSIGAEDLSNYIGFNIGWNGSNWVTGTDGTYNGAVLIITGYADVEVFSIYQIPDTGGTSQVIPFSSLPLPSFQIGAGASIKGLGTSGGLVSMSPDSGEFAVTASGFTSGGGVGNVIWAKSGNLITMYIPNLFGTSNADSFDFNLPAELTPTTAQYIAMPVGVTVDNGTSITDAIMYINFGQLQFWHNGSASGWTASGLKGTGEFTISYMLL